jgi:glycosyltransferase involved in cell wall biosynthesis
MVERPRERDCRCDTAEAGAAGRLRVLVVAAREPWPLRGGGVLRQYHFLAALGQVADVTLALPAAPQHAAHLPPGVAAVTMSGPAAVGIRGAWAVRLAGQHFGVRPVVDGWLRRHATPDRHDVVLLSGATLGVHAAAARVPVVWDLVDELVLTAARRVRGDGWRGLWSARHAWLYAAFEQAVARQVAATLVASTVDASYLRRWSGGARIVPLTNGVDGAYFGAVAAASEPGVVAFIGALEFGPNIDALRFFAGAVWPALQRSGAARRLLIVGRRPVPEVRRLADLPGVELHADVPDVRPLLARARVVVVPTRQGGGVKNKVLEACAAGRAVVASPAALGGLSARPGRELLCAATPDEWQRQVRRLLAAPALAARVAAAGRSWVQRAHRWDVLGERLRAELARAAGRRKGAIGCR